MTLQYCLGASVCGLVEPQRVKHNDLLLVCVVGGASAWPLQVPRFSEPSMPSVGWHLTESTELMLGFGLSKRHRPQPSQSQIPAQLHFLSFSCCQVARSTDGKKKYALLLDHALSLLSPRPLISPPFSKPSSRSSSGSCPSSPMCQVHAPALAAPGLSLPLPEQDAGVRRGSNTPNLRTWLDLARRSHRRSCSGMLMAYCRTTALGGRTAEQQLRGVEKATFPSFSMYSYLFHHLAHT